VSLCLSLIYIKV